jgi:hypothetical protein
MAEVEPRMVRYLVRIYLSSQLAYIDQLDTNYLRPVTITCSNAFICRYKPDSAYLVYAHSLSLVVLICISRMGVVNSDDLTFFRSILHDIEDSLPLTDSTLHVIMPSYSFRYPECGHIITSLSKPIRSG